MPSRVYVDDDGNIFPSPCDDGAAAPNGAAQSGGDDSSALASAAVTTTRHNTNDNTNGTSCNNSVQVSGGQSTRATANKTMKPAAHTSTRLESTRSIAA
eukprot:CAMPEP_0178667756 /NCGR_PEP_ID=MMETSP0698-20121128/31218_1 /TAXON_ID=265572 /ORGANISM="Extubocellulus spinifer, Strain CCMP396" /LENGTH=98 /DNA_ID=CAMNT_0020311281 /DNA_START=173 /DNA_END=466 /DNA_ORIENTATION=+